MFQGLALIGIAIVLALILSYVYLANRSNSGLPRVQVTIGSAHVDAELALGAVSRARGLSGRESLAIGEGMLFSFGSAGYHSFWMHGMQFPIDIVWMRDGLVVGVTPNVDPQIGAQVWQLDTYAPPEPAEEVLEVPAGYAAANGIVPGARVVVQRPE